MNKRGDGIQCPKCKDKIYSDSVHDFKYCSCGYCFVDGGYDYLRCGWESGDKAPKTVKRPNVKKLSKAAKQKP